MTDFKPIVHRVTGTTFPVNSFLVETEQGVVVVDAMLTVSDSTAVRQQLESLNKPLLGVLITHSHPDHYAGLAQIVQQDNDNVPIVALAGVNDTIRRDDAEKDGIISPMFGSEWPQKRLFPTQTVEDGEQLTFDGVTFSVVDLGPGESSHDSLWYLEPHRQEVFVGDLVYNHMHGFLQDGFYQTWLKNLERFSTEFRQDVRLYVGHGQPASKELLDWQSQYIHTFVNAIRLARDLSPNARQKQVADRMKRLLPTDDLLFLMELSIEPMAEKLYTA